MGDRNTLFGSLWSDGRYCSSWLLRGTVPEQTGASLIDSYNESELHERLAKHALLSMPTFCKRSLLARPAKLMSSIAPLSISIMVRRSPAETPPRCEAANGDCPSQYERTQRSAGLRTVTRLVRQG